MRTKSISIFVVLALVALLGVAWAGTASAQSTQPEAAAETPRTLSVSGSGLVSLVPDIAHIYIGIHTENKNASEAVGSNNAQTQAVIEALSGFGIDEKDIQTSNFSVYPQQEWGPDGQVTGVTYVVDNTVLVAVRDLEQIGQILDEAVKAGANSISGIQFDVVDREAANQQAMQAAIANAQARAEVLAEAAGVQLGAIQTIEASMSSIQPYPVERAYAMDATQAAVPVSPGQMQISYEVYVIFTIQ